MMQDLQEKRDDVL